MVGIAVVGAGYWGPNLIANFRDDPRSEVRWVVDRDPERRALVASRFPELRVAAALDEALGDPEVDAVVIATPTSTHCELASAALESGRHVLVEKPMADDARGAERLCRAAEAADRVLLVGHIFLFNGAAQVAKGQLDEGALGHIYYLSMLRTNLGPIRVDVNTAWDLASHDISLASYWLGAPPRSVSALGGAWINPGIEDAVFATLRYPEDVLVNIHASWLSPRKARDITVVGEKRMLTFDDMDLERPLRIYDKQVADRRSRPGFVDSFESFRTSVHTGSVEIPRIPHSEPLRNECGHFLDCIEGGEVPRCGGREGLAVVLALEALSESLRSGGREVPVREAGA